MRQLYIQQKEQDKGRQWGRRGHRTLAARFGSVGRARARFRGVVVHCIRIRIGICAFTTFGTLGTVGVGLVGHMPRCIMTGWAG